MQTQQSKDNFARFAAKHGTAPMSHEELIRAVGESLVRDYGKNWSRVWTEIAAVAQQVSQAAAHAKEVK